MKSHISNISVAQRPMPPATVMAPDGGTDTGSGAEAGAIPSNLNVTGTLTCTGTSSVTVNGDVTVVGMVESEFLGKFREKFVGSGAAKPWPRAAVNTKAEFSTEFTDVFRSMFLRREASIDPPEGEPGSAKQMIKELIEETGWPDNAAIPVAEPWKSQGRVVAFRRYEITCAMYILMQEYHAQNNDGAGGGSSELPPNH